MACRWLSSRARPLSRGLPSQHLHMALELSHRVDQGQEREYRFCSFLNQPEEAEEVMGD